MEIMCRTSMKLSFSGGVKEMIKCKSKYAHGCECVIDMSSAELIGGSICCDTAEDLNFNREKILNCCKYAEHEDIKNADLKELLS